jgi:hypothetical protein
MDVDLLLDGVTNSTQASDALSDALKTPDLAHIKAAALVVVFMLCRDLGKHVIPLVLKQIKESLGYSDLASVLSKPQEKKD